jgi:hypothetical protein
MTCVILSETHVALARAKYLDALPERRRVSCRQIAEVRVDGSSVGPVASYTFTNVQVNDAIAASYAADSITITSTAGAKGSVSPASAAVACGGDLKVTITPENPYQVASLTVDGDPVTVATSYVFANVHANHALHATSDIAVVGVIIRIEAETVSDGIAIRWQLGVSGAFTSMNVERSVAESGPWAAIRAAVGNEGDLTVAVDRTAAAGASYYYRFVGITQAGTQVVFGPVKGTSGSPREFALSNLQLNPSKGGYTMSFALAKSAQVRAPRDRVRTGSPTTGCLPSPAGNSKTPP